MKVIITGGTGLIGRALTQRLEQADHDVVVVSRRPQDAAGFSPGVTLKEWDAASVDAIQPILEGADAVVHLAGANIGAGRWTENRKKLLRESRVDSTKALAQACLACRQPPAKFIQGSAVGFYGPRGDEPVDETAAVGRDFLASLCSDWEAASDAVKQAGIRRVVARTGVVLAKDGGALPRILLPFRLFAGGPVGSGSQVLPWIHIDDEAAALAFLLETDEAEGVFNLAAPNAVTNRELAQAIGRVLRRPGFVPTPAFVIRLALGEMSTLVLEGQRAVPRNLESHGFTFRFAHVKDALEDLLE